MTEIAAERVEVYRTFECSLAALSLDKLHKSLSNFNSLTGAACKIDFYCRESDVFENDSHIGGFRYLETERIDAFVEHVERYGVCFFGGVGNNVLTGEPVVIAACAAYIGILTGERIGGF